MRRFMRVLQFTGLGLLALVLVLAVGGFWFVRWPWPQIDGQITAQGLTAPVEIIRDTWGVVLAGSRGAHAIPADDKA